MNTSPDAPAHVKTCSRCKQSLPLADFPRDRRNRDHRYGWCRACVRAAKKRRDCAVWPDDD